MSASEPGPVLQSSSFLRVGLKNLNSLSNKVHFVSHFLHVNNIDVFCINETWISPGAPDGIYQVNGFQIFRNDFVSDYPKHGVCIYVKDSIRVGKVQNDFPNVLALHIVDFDFYVMTVYRPPSNSVADNGSLIGFLDQFLLHKEVLILGDFNLPSIKWNSSSPDSQASRLDRLFFDHFTVLGLKQYVTEPTFISSSNILDLVLSTESDRITNLNIFPPFPNCGHVIVTIDYVFQSDISQHSMDTPLNRIYNWSRGKYDKMIASLERIDWDLKLMFLGINDAYEEFSSTIKHHIDKFVPTKTIKSSVPPYEKGIPPSLLRGRAACWKTYKQHRTQFGRHSHQAQLSYYRFNATNMQLKNLMLNKRIEYECSILEQYKDKPKLFHSYIKKKKSSRPRLGPLLMSEVPGDVLTDDPAAMAELFAHAFSSVYSPEDPQNPFPHQISNGRIDHITIDKKSIELVLSSLKNDSSTGPDEIPSCILKRCASALSYPLMLLFQLSLQDRSLPAIWKVSHVVYIYIYMTPLFTEYGDTVLSSIVGPKVAC